MNTIRAIADFLASGKTSSVELCQDYLARIAAHNPALNAFISVDAERTLGRSA